MPQAKVLLLLTLDSVFDARSGEFIARGIGNTINDWLQQDGLPASVKIATEEETLLFCPEASVPQVRLLLAGKDY